jgi:type IV secretory pathway TraG/TraD family ATPase VirD4
LSGQAVTIVAGLVLVFAALGFWGAVTRFGLKQTLERAARFVLGIPLTWMLLAAARKLTGYPAGWLIFPLWGVLVLIVLKAGGGWIPGPVRRLWASLFSTKPRDTHGSAHFGTAREAARHLAPAAPADAFVLGTMRDAPRGTDRRFRQDGHLLTCAPTGAGKGIGAVIPNLLDYPGSAFVLDFKGENHAVTARARRAMGQDVILIDPFGIAGVPTHCLNWLDTLDPDDPDVVSRAAGLADMLADPERGHRLPARTAAVHLNRPERERGSVLSSVVRHTAWLDDPRLCAALARSDFSMTDLKRRPVTVYLAIPPDRLRVCLGFVRGFIGLALDGIAAVPALPPHRVGFFLDEFGQLGRMDRLADSITLLRGYGAQLWVFVQDLSQIKAVYPRWQSFLANTAQQFFGTADYDTARYLSAALGQQTIRFETGGSSYSDSGIGKPGSASTSTGEHFQGRPLLTPDEIMRLGPTRPIVLVAGEPPYLLDRIGYLTDPAYAGRFDPNPMHRREAAE